MPVYVVAQGRIEDRPKLDEYVGKALPTIQAAGARVLAFDESPDVVEALVGVIKTGSEDGQKFAAWAVAKLAYNAENQAGLPSHMQNHSQSKLLVCRSWEHV